jgi:signal transduction histidine kinase
MAEQQRDLRAISRGPSRAIRRPIRPGAQGTAEFRREATGCEDERERTLTATVGGIAHYFNNVLAYMLGGLQLLSEEQLGDEACGLVERMEARVLEGSQMVRALQQFAAEKPPERLEEIDLGQLVEELVVVFRQAMDGAAVATDCEIEVLHAGAHGPLVLGNRRDIREALLNLLFNAAQALPEGGTIRLTSGEQGLWSYVEVADDGVGMARQVVKRARDPFFTTQPGERQGLGLSVASGIARRHGGEVSILSEPGQGSVVRLTLLRAA